MFTGLKAVETDRSLRFEMIPTDTPHSTPEYFLKADALAGWRGCCARRFMSAQALALESRISDALAAYAWRRIMNRYGNPRALFEGSVISDWLMLRTDISPGAKLCYARLAKYFDKDKGVAWPKIETLASQLGASGRQSRHLFEGAEGCQADRSGEKGSRWIEPVSIPRPQHFCVS